MQTKRYPYITLFIFSCLTFSCSMFQGEAQLPCDFESTPLLGKDTSLVVGSWIWQHDNINTHEGCFKRTPRTEGYSQRVVFYENGVYERYQDGELVNEWVFRFDISELDDTGLSIFMGRPGQIGIATAFGVSADTLVLDSSGLDGPQSIYLREGNFP